MSLIMPLTPVEIIDPTKERNLVHRVSFSILRNISTPTERFLDSKPPELAISDNIEFTEFDLIL
jgi:hypothetical protein